MDRRHIATATTLLALVVFGGCAELEPNGYGVTTSVGPEGALIEASPADGVPAVAIDIAPGALDRRVEVSIRTGNDATALPPGAFAVGEQVHIEPVDLAFDAAVWVTLPVDAVARDGYGVGFEDVKVWQRDPTSETGWTKLEPMTSSQTTATVALERFDTVVTGVKLDPPEP